LAQYLWLNKVHQTQVMVHVGKHGSAEWLPGKGVGLSSSCGPHLALGALPHLYPFIVNDPGEGSQAKRRGHAVVLDHLTPPLGRAGLHGPLQRLEGQLDELVEARQLGAERSELLEHAVLVTLQELNWPGVPSKDDLKSDPSLINECLDSAETYLCELKEAQIRTGLHRFGQRPSKKAELELLLALARPPGHGRPGLTQAMARQVGLAFDPWGQEDGEPLDQTDRHLLEQLGCDRRQRVGDGVAWLEDQAFGLVSALIGDGDASSLVEPFRDWIHSQASDDGTLAAITQDLWPRLIQCAPSEQKAFCEGISGGRISAGPSGAPSRGRPDVLPTGRNFYSVDLRGLPTEAAWDLGRRSAEQLLDLHLQEEGENLKHLALSVWGTATMRNGGEDIAQLLALIGVRPVWDGPTRRLVDLEVIPLRLLGRPRVDVVLRISGLFRDAFPQLVMWVDQAIAMVAALNEPSDQNPLAALTQQEGPQGRIYGSAPGAYGAGLQALMDSGSWDSRSDLGEAFLQWSQWNYGGSSEPSKDRKGLESALQRVQVVLHNQDNREHDLLDSDDYYQFHGGLSAAVETSSGRRPELWFGDHSRRERPRLHRLEHELDKVMRSRLLNPRWIEGMQQHGYKGAFEMGASLDYLFAYDAATDRVPDWCYGALCDQWLNNPSIVEFLGSATRGYFGIWRSGCSKLQIEGSGRAQSLIKSTCCRASFPLARVKSNAVASLLVQIPHHLPEGINRTWLPGDPGLPHLGNGLFHFLQLFLTTDGIGIGRCWSVHPGNRTPFQALVHFLGADLFGEGFLHRFWNASGEVDAFLNFHFTTKTFAAFLEFLGFRSDFHDLFLRPGAINRAGKGATNRFRLPHVVHIAQGRRGVGIQKKLFGFVLGRLPRLQRGVRVLRIFFQETIK
jgi:cobaltochelatase CobN